MDIIAILLTLVAAYVALGIPAALLLLLRRLPARDESLRGASWAVRLVLLPGAVALWPLLLVSSPERVARSADAAGSARGVRRRHGWLLGGVLLLVPIAGMLAWGARPQPVVLEGSLPPELRQPAPLPVVVHRDATRFSRWGVEVALRSNRFQTAYQVEVAVGRPLPFPDAVAYYFPAQPGSSPVFLGMIPDSGTRRFPVAASVAGGRGTVGILSARTGEILGAGG